MNDLSTVVIDDLSTVVIDKRIVSTRYDTINKQRKFSMNFNVLG